MSIVLPIKLVNLLQYNAAEPGYVNGFLAVNSDVHFDYFVAGLYYGFVAVALMLNVFFYFTFRDRKILLYMALLSAIVLSFAHSDGLLALQLSHKLLNVTRGLAHLLVGIGSSCLALHLLKGRAVYKTLRVIAFISCSALFVLYSINAMAPLGLYFYVADVVLFSVMGIYLFAGIVTISNNVPVRCFLISYLAVYFLALDFYIISPAGYDFVQVTNEQLKAASVVEMTVFLMVTVYKIYRTQAEKRLSEISVNHFEELPCEPLPGIKLPGANFENLCTLYGLTESELKVFKCIAQGMSNTEISQKLFISVNTVKYHNRNIYEKLDIKSKSQAVSKILSLQVNSN